MGNDKLLNLVEAAPYCDLNRQTLAKYADQGRVQAVSIEGKGRGKRYFFKAEHLDSFLENRWSAGTWKVVEVAE